MTYPEICKAALAAPGIEHGFFQYTVALDKNPKAVRNPGGGFQSSHEYREGYRVVLYMDRTIDVTEGSPTNGRAKGGMCETENTDLAAAIREAFGILKLPVPEAFTAKRK